MSLLELGAKPRLMNTPATKDSVASPSAMVFPTSGFAHADETLAIAKVLAAARHTPRPRRESKMTTMTAQVTDPHAHDESGGGRLVAGAEIDYSEGLEGAQFVIKNPNATTTCGCGSSFSA